MSRISVIIKSKTNIN